MTDGTVSIGAEGESKRFDIQDGLGLRLLQRHGVRVGWISNRPSFATSQRAAELRIDFLHQQEGSKREAVAALLGGAGLEWESLCYMGDDVVDLGVMARVGVAVAVANAVDDVKARADYVTHASGGHGAVREVAERILKAQRKWNRIIEEFSK